MSQDLYTEIKCDHANCPATELYKPILKMWAQGHKVGSHPPARLQVGNLYCKEHQPSQTDFLDSYFPPENRAKLREYGTAAGKAPFNWASAKLEWERYA